MCLNCVCSVFEMKEKRKAQSVKRVQVSFTEEQWQVIERFRGTMGATDADIIRNIVLAWLAEKSVIASDAKRRIEAGKP